MSILYKAPLEHFDWGQTEFRVLLRGLASPSGVDRREELRKWLAERYESEAVTLFNSGRSALEAAAAHLVQASATRAAGRRASGVLMPSLVCDSVPRKIAGVGLRPVFFDMTPGMAPDLEDAMRRIDGDTLAVLIPYVYGLVIDIDPLVRVCRAQGIAIIEDCAPSALLPAPGGRMSGLTGDYTILSFQLGKTLVAGGGGALIRRNQAAAAGVDAMQPRPWTAEEERALVRSKRGFLLRYGYPGAGYYMSRLLGPIDLGLAYQAYNQVHSMAAVDSALVFCQIERWPELRAQREAILRQCAAAATPDRAYSLPQLDRHKAGTYVQRLFVEFPADVVEWNSDGSSRSTLFEFLEKRGLQSQKTYCPAHELAEFQEWATGPLPETERLVRRVLAVPTQPRLRAATVEWIRSVLQEAAERVAGGEYAAPPRANRGVRFA